MQVLLQYQSKSYYIIGQEDYYSIGRFITLSGVFYYIIGQLLQYRAFITLLVGTTVLTFPPTASSEYLYKIRIKLSSSTLQRVFRSIPPGIK